MLNYRFIDDPQCLEIWSQDLKNQDLLAVDTEFTRRDTYFPQLNLIQISANNLPIALIDSQNQMDFASLLNPFQEMTVIFHSGSQDQGLLEAAIGCAAGNYRDTQLLYAFLSDNNQVSYQALCESFMGIKINKAATQSDWSARPLSDKQLHYAAEDVAYLAALHEAMWQRLSEQKKAWYVAACTEMYGQLSSDQQLIDQAWQKVSPLHHLDDAALAAGQVAASWREACAMARDRPKKWLFDDEALMHMAKSRRTDGAIKPSRGRAGLSASELDALQSQLSQAPDTPIFPRIRSQHSSPQLKARLKTIKAAVRDRCEALQIAVGAVANRDDFSRAASGAPTRMSTGWRAEVLEGIDLGAEA